MEALQKTWLDYNLKKNKNGVPPSDIKIHSIALDYLTIMYSGKLELDHEKPQAEINDIVIEPLKYGEKLAGNKHFNNVSTVYFEGFKIGELRYNPRNSAIMEPDTVSFKADNCILYMENFSELIEQMANRLGLKFHHVSKLDICADGAGLLQPIDSWFRGHCEKVSNTKVTPYFRTEQGKPFLEGYHIGSRRSDKFARAYYKRRELNTSGKFYIQQFWETNKLAEKCGTDDIQRLELSLKNNEIKKWLTKKERNTWEGFKEILDSTLRIAELFKASIASIFDFREVAQTNKVNVSRLKRIFLLDFSPLGLLKGIERAGAIVSTKLRSLKTTAKNLWLLYKKTGMQHFSQLGEEISANLFHTIWFEKSKKKWGYEFQRENKKYGDYFPLYDCVERNYTEFSDGSINYIEGYNGTKKLELKRFFINEKFARRILKSQL